MPTLLTTLLLVFWVVVIAILSVQNYTLISLKFLGFQSIRLSLGIILAVSVGVGAVGMAICQWLSSLDVAEPELEEADAPEEPSEVWDAWNDRPARDENTW